MWKFEFGFVVSNLVVRSGEQDIHTPYPSALEFWHSLAHWLTLVQDGPL